MLTVLRRAGDLPIQPRQRIVNMRRFAVARVLSEPAHRLPYGVVVAKNSATARWSSARMFTAKPRRVTSAAHDEGA